MSAADPEARRSGHVTSPAAAALDRLTPLFVVLLNLVPLAGVLWFGWRAELLLLLYWAENVIVGGFAALRILASGAARGAAGAAGALFLTAFFCVHYGIFCGGHLFFLTVMFAPRDLGAGFPNPFELLTSDGALWSLLALALLQLYDAVVWLLSGGPRRSEPKAEMFRPYPRMILLHVTIIAAGFAVVAVGQPVWAVTILAALKTGFDLWSHRQAVRRRRAEALAA